MGIEAAGALPIADGLSLGKGAILGAMLVGAALLAGVAVLRKNAAALFGLAMVASAAVLAATWLGIGPAPAPSMSFLLEGLFGASCLIFLSATIGMASRSQVLGGILFAGALSIMGVAILNIALGGEAAHLRHWGVAGVAGAALLLAGMASARGDAGARLIFPGAALAAAAPLLLNVTGAGGLAALAPAAIFAIGVLVASLVALLDLASPARVVSPLAPAARFGEEGGGAAPRSAHYHSHAELQRVSENQLAQVLDYSGIAVWDWTRTDSRQSASFAALMGADCDGAFTPDAFGAFVHADDLARFEAKICGAADSDGGFDEVLKLNSGKRVRVRGARAVDAKGDLERIVVFIEDAACAHDAALDPHKEDALKLAAASLTGAAVAAVAPSAPPGPAKIAAPAAPKPAAPRSKFASATAAASDGNIVAAIDRGEIVAAFQPIVSFETGKVCGAEALVRWPCAGEQAGRAAEEIVRKAQLAGKGRALAALMLRAAAKHVCEHLNEGNRKYFAAFNVSVSQLRDEDFIEDVRLAIGDHKLPPGSLVLELTEGERLAETPKIAETFKKLRSAGVALAYDDFGAGFSSLANLHKYDFDYLKIDKSFIDDIVANGGKKKIVAALAKLGRDFDMTVIAEGVESKEAAEVAKAIGCRMGQGFYLGTPKLHDAAAKTVVSASAAPELATIEVLRPGAGEITLDRRMEVGRTPSPPVRRGLFGRR